MRNYKTWVYSMSDYVHVKRKSEKCCRHPGMSGGFGRLIVEALTPAFPRRSDKRDQDAQETKRLLDQQKVPALLPHHVPPVDVLLVARREIGVVDGPNVLEELLNLAKRAELCFLTHELGAFGEHGPEA